YQTQIVGLAQGEQTKPEYLNGVNPRGKVPALKTDDGILTENVAILTYLARSFPDAKLLPTDPLGTARALSHMAYLSNTVHPAFTHIMRPGRFATDESAHDNLKATGKDKFLEAAAGDRRVARRQGLRARLAILGGGQL